MRKVIVIASVIAIVIYCILSTAGYLGLVNQPSKLDTLLSKRNVLEVEYNNTAFSIGMLIIFFAAVTTIPLLMLPAKNDVETVVFNSKTMTTCQNIIVTVCLCSICAILAI